MPCALICTGLLRFPLPSYGKFAITFLSDGNNAKECHADERRDSETIEANGRSRASCESARETSVHPRERRFEGYLLPTVSRRICHSKNDSRLFCERDTAISLLSGVWSGGAEDLDFRLEIVINGVVSILSSDHPRLRRSSNVVKLMLRISDHSIRSRVTP